MKSLTALLLSLATLLPVLRADHRDADRHRGARVILFQHANFEGGALELFPGDSIDNLSGKSFDNGAKLNDSISSIRIEGRVEVFAYENAKFRGEALRLTNSVSDLTGRYLAGGVSVTWNDRISSLKVEGERWDNGGHGGGRPNPGPVPSGPVIDRTINNVFRDLLNRVPDAGEMREFRARFTDAGWDERMLRDYLRTDNRYRTEMANALVRRAYLEILGREADPGGLNSYRKKVLDKNWTESDVKDDLRKSAEYRNKHK